MVNVAPEYRFVSGMPSFERGRQDERLERRARLTTGIVSGRVVLTRVAELAPADDRSHEARRGLDGDERHLQVRVVVAHRLGDFVFGRLLHLRVERRLDREAALVEHRAVVGHAAGQVLLEPLLHVLREPRLAALLLLRRIHHRRRSGRVTVHLQPHRFRRGGIVGRLVDASLREHLVEHQ